MVTQLQQRAGEPSPGFFFFPPAPLTQMISCWRVQSSLCTIHVSHFVLWVAITAVFPHSPCPLLSCPFLLLYNYVRVPLIHPLSAEAHRPTFMSGFFSLSYGGGARCVFRLILATTRSTAALQFPAWQKKKKARRKSNSATVLGRKGSPVPKCAGVALCSLIQSKQTPTD